MNSCILMAKIIRSPELRYTQENQTPVATMIVEFEGVRPEEPPATLRVVSWGNMASEVQEKYLEGDRVIISGRLSMNTIERQEGFKEKRAELRVSQIYMADGSTREASASVSQAPRSGANTEVDSFSTPTSPELEAEAGEASTRTMETATATASSDSDDRSLDDIPF